MVDEIDKIKDSHRDKYNKMTLKLISINMPHWVKYIYENKSFLASLLDNPPLVAFSQLSLFNKFLITIMISGILLGIFVSASITLVMFELAAALVLIRLLDSFLNNRRKVFFDPNGAITEDFSSLSNKSCLELNKADYSFFNSLNHQEKFFIIDKDINNGEDNFSDTSSVISLN